MYKSLPILLPLLLVLSLAACGDDTAVKHTHPNNQDLDAGDVSYADAELDMGHDAELDVADPPDVPAPDFNGCGGEFELLFEDAPAAPGTACGACGDGVLICDGAEALQCLGATAENTCGGCEPLPADEGASCGACGDGAYECGQDGALHCAQATQANACGGCATLDGEPGFACSAGEGVEGWWSCANPDEVRCIAPGQNACGGSVELGASPIAPCGACNQGLVVCDGQNAVECLNEDEGVNACGGCASLEGEPESACGTCQEGVWSCEGEESVVCDGDTRNVCGGCESLGDDFPGESCPEGGVFVCANLDTLSCPDTQTNSCGGQGTLDAQPGESCGTCGDGYVVCASPELAACIGARAENACGGCSVLAATPGDSCGASTVWECTDEGSLECVTDEGRNACGGSEPLAAAPGAPCGPCDLDIFTCQDAQTVVCNGQTACPELTLVTDEASDVTATSAIFHGQLLELPLEPATDMGFCWGTDPAPAANNGECSSLGAPGEPGSLELDVDTLLPGRTYYVRAYYQDLNELTYANQVEFTTLAPAPEDLTATQGESLDNVALSWEPIEGAVGYVVYRDGDEIASLGDAAETFVDETADAAPAPLAPANVSATSGDHTDVVEITWSEPAVPDATVHTYTVVAVYPSVNSEPSEAADGYRASSQIETYQVYRDGQPLGTTAGTSFTDDQAEEGGVPDAPVVTATQGTHTDRVEVTWQAPAVSDGATHSYTVVAINAAGDGAESASDTGYRGGAPVTSYALRIDNGNWMTGQVSPSYDDLLAPAPTITPGMATASKGTSTAHVSLLVQGASANPGAQATYEVYAINGTGDGAPSAAANGWRGVGNLSAQWERSSGDAPANFATLLGATTTSHDDTTAPADGSARYYRVRLQATGAGSEYSNDDRGFRAAEAGVQTHPVADITTTSATANGELVSLGAPSPSDHGFCWATSSNPDLNDTCTSLGSTGQTGTFSEQVTGLLAGTRYHVRAWATNNAGTSFGDNQTFVTLPVAPTLSASSGTHVGHVALSWNAVTGATTYLIYRDNVLLDTVSGNSFDDASASAGSAPEAPTVSATFGTHRDRVEVTWNAPAFEDGAPHTYRVVAVNESGAGAPSNNATGHRAGSPILRYELKVGDANWADMGLSLSFTHGDAPAGVISAGTATASAGTIEEHVALALNGSSVQPGATLNYQVRAVNAVGTGAPGQHLGYRSVGPLTYQWQRSAGDSDANYSNIGGATSTTYNDAAVPDDGSAFYYRAVVSADGANPANSNAARGYRKHCSGSGSVVFNNSSTGPNGTIQTWTVPEGACRIRIVGLGAQGGSNYIAQGGRGASIAGDFNVEPGDQLRILVGQAGASSSGTDRNGAGGGGTFVVTANNTPLLVAAGGTGANNSDTLLPPGGSGELTSNTNGGLGDDNNRGCGGGGFVGNGGANGCQGGRSFLNGGAGDPGNNLPGGFGGGGGAGINSSSGGGGGYSGGDGVNRAEDFSTRQPARSYNAGTNHQNLTGQRAGHGRVTITW